jgi:hypothetical protein
MTRPERLACLTSKYRLLDSVAFAKEWYNVNVI